MIQFEDPIFQVGWFNHQLAQSCCGVSGLWLSKSVKNHRYLNLCFSNKSQVTLKQHINYIHALRHTYHHTYINIFIYAYIYKYTHIYIYMYILYIDTLP